MESGGVTQEEVGLGLAEEIKCGHTCYQVRGIGSLSSSLGCDGGVEGVK